MRYPASALTTVTGRASERLAEASVDGFPHHVVARVPLDVFVVQDPYVSVAGVEAEHDDNNPIVLDVDAGADLLESDQREAFLPLGVQLVDVGGAALGRLTERQIAPRGEGSRVAAFDLQPGLAPCLAHLRQRAPAAVETAQSERDAILVGRVGPLRYPLRAAEHGAPGAIVVKYSALDAGDRWRRSPLAAGDGLPQERRARSAPTSSSGRVTHARGSTPSPRTAPRRAGRSTAPAPEWRTCRGRPSSRGGRGERRRPGHRPSCRGSCWPASSVS